MFTKVLLVLFSLSYSAMAAPEPSQMTELTRGPAVTVAKALGVKLYYTPYELNYRVNDAQQTQVTGYGLSEAQASVIAYMVMSEYRLYPRDCVRRTQLKKIIFTSSLRVGALSVTSMPDFGNDLMIYDFSLANATEHTPIQSQAVQAIIHHEFMHFWDFKDDGNVMSDPVWSRLNPPGFQYGSGGSHMRDSRAQLWYVRRQGFLNAYSTSGVEEDKAEIFGALMARPGDLARRISGDFILTSKVNLLQAQMNRFCGAINPGFWNLARQSAGNRLSIILRLLRGESVNAPLGMPKGR